jgi:hypothetical protein
MDDVGRTLLLAALALMLIQLGQRLVIDGHGVRLAALPAAAARG